MKGLKLILLTQACVTALTAAAASNVQVVGLFPGAAVLNVDGQRKLVKVGQTGPGGVQVLSADSRGAVLRVNGVERSYSLSREYSEGFAESAKPGLSVAKGQGGHYWVAGSINEQMVHFMVDTGATAVAMNEDQARRLGLDYRVTGQPMQLSTASGLAQGWRVTLQQVKVGDLEVLGVEAIVVAGSFPSETLLGMSFLSRVGWRVEQDRLVLEAKY